MSVINFDQQINATHRIHDAIKQFLESPSMPHYGFVIDSMRNNTFLIPYIATKNLHKLNKVSVEEMGGGPDTIKTELNEIALPIFCKDRVDEIHESKILQYNAVSYHRHRRWFEEAPSKGARVSPPRPMGYYFTNGSKY